MEMIVAGHGGQGILELANYISFYEFLKGRHVAYTPSYGPESRGGKVKCYVIIADEEIDSPIVEEPDWLIVMNLPSMDFVPLLKKGGTLLFNSSLVSEEPARIDIHAFKISATETAGGLSNSEFANIVADTKIVANSVMFGAYLFLAGEAFGEELVRRVFGHFFTERKAMYIPLNVAAAQRGSKLAESIIALPAAHYQN